MPFLKRTIMWTLFLAAMYFGGAGAQSSSNFLQGMGFVSMVVACVCLYIIFKLIWGPLGNFTRLLIIGGILIYTAFSIGLFNGNTLQSFLNGSPRPIQAAPVSVVDNDQIVDELGIQMFGDLATNHAASTQPTEAQTNAAEAPKPNSLPYIPQAANMQIPVNQESSSGGFWNKFKSMFGGNQSANLSSGSINPLNYPEMYGHPQVLSGSILVLNGIKIRLFGIEAPEPGQTCENKYGNSYLCGKESIIWMRNWLNQKDVSCRILSKVQNGRTIGTCFSDDGKYDVAAAIVNAGWAVAYTEHTQIYVPYEQDAAMARRGLWAGQFYKPWDWRKIQSRKAKITVTAPKNNNKKWFNFKGLF